MASFRDETRSVVCSCVCGMLQQRLGYVVVVLGWPGGLAVAWGVAKGAPSRTNLTVCSQTLYSDEGKYEEFCACCLASNG